MDVRFSTAASAYGQALKRADGAAPEAPEKAADAKASFSNLVSEAVKSASGASQAAEAASLQALVAPTDLSQVVLAVSNAEVTLQTVVAVRDRVIQAYQDIMKMPI